MDRFTNSSLGKALACVGTALAIGAACGLGAVILSELAELACAAFDAHPVLVYALPVCAIVTIFLYRIAKVALRFSTIDCIVRQRAGKLVPVALAPCIAIGTALTLLGGGSVGKEAAALQMGAAIASGVGGKVKAFKEHEGLIVSAGMAAAFSALLFAPLAATCFVMELARNRRKTLLDWHVAVIPIAAVVAWGIASLFGVGRLWSPWTGAIAAPSAYVIPETLAVGFAAAVVGMLFVVMLKALRTGCVKRVPNPFASTAICGFMVIFFVIAFGTEYSGTGASLIAAALNGEEVPFAAFAIKLGLTAVCLAFGFKGGEVMPVLCAGACLGSSVAQVTGADPAFMAAIGMVALFAACTGCPGAAILLSVEAFGVAAAPWFLAAVLIAHFASLRVGLYDTNSWNLERTWSKVKELFHSDMLAVFKRR